MRANLDASRGLPLAEAAVAALAGPLGTVRARELVDQAARAAAAGGRPLRATLLEAPAVAAATWARPGSKPGPDPERYLGSAQALMDRALAAHGGVVSGG